MGLTRMNNNSQIWIANFILGIADDVLRDVYARSKYRDVILPMVVIRRLDAALEPTKPAMLAMKKNLDAAGVADQDAALRQAAGQAFYNTSPFTLRDLLSRAKAQQLKADFETYLDGFSPNVQEILDKLRFRSQIPALVEAGVLASLIEKLLDSAINFSPWPVRLTDGSERLPALDNQAMRTIFEELIRRFNEESNEEAGEYFTSRDVVRIMAGLGVSQATAVPVDRGAPGESGKELPLLRERAGEGHYGLEPGHPTTPILDQCQLKAIYPVMVRPEGWSPLWAYIYTRSELAEVAEDEDLLARDRGPLAWTPSSAGAKIARGVVLTVKPDGPGLRFDPPSQSAVWLGRWPGTVAFAVEGLRIGEVPFELLAGSVTGAGLQPSLGRLYGKVFPSYSHLDKKIVERVERAYKILGLDYLRDVTTLRSGKKWKPELLRFIEEADAFQLFWSRAAAESRYVTEEWQAAVRLIAGNKKEETFIRPVYWKAPMPQPPKPLKEIHFAFEPDLGR